MVSGGIRRLRRWRSIGVPFSIVFSTLFNAKILARFTYLFSLFPSSKLEEVCPVVWNIFDTALCNAFGQTRPKGVKPPSGIQSVICGIPPVRAFLRQEKLKLAARLKVACHQGGYIFRYMLEMNNGSFGADIRAAVNEWLLSKQWSTLNGNKCWSMDLPTGHSTST